MSDQKKLIQDCQNKSAKAFDELYRLYSPLVYGVCLRYTKNKSEAQDLLQDCFMKIINKIGDFRFEGSFEGWLRKLAVNESINFLKLNKNSFIDNIDDTNIPVEDLNSDTISNMSANEIIRFISQMPDGYRTIFNMHVIEGYKHTEISKILNITDSTSRTQLKKAREYLELLIERENNK